MSTVTHGPRSAGWAIDDAVTRLRRWGKRDGFELPTDVHSLLVGAADECDLRIQDQIGSVSRQHAELTREAGVWTLKDRGSKNGSRLDGERRLSFALTPGIEVEIGEVKLIAESDRLVTLQAFLARILGFDDRRLAAIDEALRGIRDAAARRGTLLLCGAGSLVSTARRIHELALGTTRPFVVAEGTNLRDATESAAGGTLCVDGAVTPSELTFARDARESALFICARTADEAAEAVPHVQRGTIVEIPPLLRRGDEREQLILEYASDATRVLGVGTNGFREHELVWLGDVQLPSLEEIEELMLRLVAERVFGPTHGAAKLGITRRALSEYLRRRGIPL
ncbi:MAG: FHA domain-containing protein [Deltaproteobacteria bacterium]|nr:FHA domain-containing protein [Deltaproteobacteria bacterium]